MTTFTNQAALIAFESRYPQLAFLSTLDHEPYRLTKDEIYNAEHLETSEKVFEDGKGALEIRTFETCLQQGSTIECLVVFGLGLGELFVKAKEWLKNNPKRDLVFIEDKLWKIKAFLETKYATEFLSHPQVHLRYILDHNQMVSAFDEITLDFPVESVLVFSLKSFLEEEQTQTLKELYMRRSIITSSLYKEGFFSHKLFENFFPNYLQLLNSKNIQRLKGEFEGVPAVICGAGPSLDESIEHLKALENKALIIAGGSTITALSRKGVQVDLGFAVDPNEEEYCRLKQAQCFDMPLLFATRVYPEIFDFFNGPLGYFRTCTGGPFERAVEEKLNIENEPFHVGMKDEGLSVTVLCLSTAIAMGCNPIFLVGVDLAYVDNKCYADKVTTDNEVKENEIFGRDAKLTKTNSVGEPLDTTLKWVMESEVISHFANLHKDYKIYDCVPKGLGFENIEKLSPSKISSKCPASYDLKGLVHQRFMSLSHLSEYRQDLLGYLKDLQKSFSKCIELCDQIITRASYIEDQEFEEDALISLYYIEIEEEMADIYFLKVLRDRIDDFFIQRFLRVKDGSCPFSQKWKYIKSCCHSFLSTIKSCVPIH